MLDLIGDKWSLLIVRDILMYDKHEYKEFLSSPEAIATNILADRLKKLVKEGVLGVIPHPENKSRKLYYALKPAKDLLPVLGEMVVWADKHLPIADRMRPVAQTIRDNPAVLRRQILAASAEWEEKFLSSRGNI
jgi:DNA-binding HxlR family transcriptional regulator